MSNILKVLEEKGVKISNWAPSYNNEIDPMLETYDFEKFCLQALEKKQLKEICVSRFINKIENKLMSTDLVFLAAVDNWVILWNTSKKQILFYRLT